MEGGIPTTTYSNVSMISQLRLFETGDSIPMADNHPLQPPLSPTVRHAT